MLLLVFPACNDIIVTILIDQILLTSYFGFKIVLECTRLQREGKLVGTSLMSALRGRLFGLVGQEEYNKCEEVLNKLLHSKFCTKLSIKRKED